MPTGRETVSSTTTPLDPIEFPANDLARAQHFSETLLDISLDGRKQGERQGPRPASLIRFGDGVGIV